MPGFATVKQRIVPSRRLFTLETPIAIVALQRLRHEFDFTKYRQICITKDGHYLFCSRFSRRKPLVDGSLIFDVGAYQAQFRIFRLLRDTGAFEASWKRWLDEGAKPLVPV